MYRIRKITICLKSYLRALYTIVCATLLMFSTHNAVCGPTLNVEMSIFIEAIHIHVDTNSMMPHTWDTADISVTKEVWNTLHDNWDSLIDRELGNSKNLSVITALSRVLQEVGKFDDYETASSVLGCMRTANYNNIKISNAKYSSIALVNILRAATAMSENYGRAGQALSGGSGAAAAPS